MNLTAIVKELKENATVFEQRVAGAAEFEALDESARLATPCAYVIGEPDNPDRANTNAHYRQDVEDRFTVVVVVDNPDERGQVSWDNSDALRTVLWLVLLGWQIDEYHNPIEYTGGGELIEMNRAHAYIAFGFAAKISLGPSDTRQGVDLDKLPELTDIKLGVDVIDPAYDPNNVDDGRETHNPDQPNPRTSGPDGRVEVGADLTIPQE